MALSLIAALLPACTPSSGPLHADGGVYFVDADRIEPVVSALAFDLDARVLRDDSVSGVALDVTIPAGWAHVTASRFDRRVEFVVIDGVLDVGAVPLTDGDYLGIETGTLLPPLASVGGARLLLFADGGRATRSAGESVAGDWPDGLRHVAAADTGWVSGTAMAEAGRDDVPLRIRHYRNDPDTGARTYLVAVEPGVVIPWETHDVAEEAYVVSGDYTLSECLNGNEVTGTYLRGGYFYRPPGIAHNGPRSGTRNGTVMLIRTPGPLTVELVDGCR